MQEMQWASKRLVSNLVHKEKYELAAYVVLGAKAVFDMYSKLISDTVEKSSGPSDKMRRRDLEFVLEQAKEEIREHRRWQEEILSSLPRRGEALGLTAPLRLAFNDASDARKKLLQQVMLIHGEFLESDASKQKEAHISAVQHIVVAAAELRT